MSKSLSQTAKLGAGNPAVLREALRYAALLLIALVAILAIRGLYENIFLTQDEGITLVYPDLILRGYIPYSDFAILYPPGAFYILAGAFRLFSESVQVERAVGATEWLLVVTAIFSIGLRVNFLTAVLSATTSLAYFSLHPFLDAGPHFPAFAAMLFSMTFASRTTDGSRSMRSFVAAGALAGTTLWFKQDIGVVAIVGALVCVNPFRFDRVRSFLGGVAIPVVAWIAYTLIIGPQNLFDSLVLDPMRSAPGRFIPLRMSPQLAVVLLCLAIQSLAVIRLRSARTPEHLLWLVRGSAVLSIALAMSVMHRFEPIALGFLGIPIVSLTVLVLQVAIHYGFAIRKNIYAASAICFAACVLPVLLSHVAGTVVPRFQADWVHSGERSVPLTLFGRVTGRDLQRTLDDIERLSSPGSTLFVGQSDLRFANFNDTFIYYLLSRLRPVSRYLEMNPGCANRSDSGLPRELAQADWLILTASYESWNEPNASRLPGSAEPNEFVRAHFCEQSRYGPWQLLRRCN